jgi:hypothetical protein
MQNEKSMMRMTFISRHRRPQRHTHLRLFDILLDLRQSTAQLCCLFNLLRHFFLLTSDMRPGKFFLQIVRLLFLFSSFGSFFVSQSLLTESSTEIGQSLFLDRQQFRSRRDVIETKFVFFRKLGQLGATKEELEREKTKIFKFPSLIHGT